MTERTTYWVDGQLAEALPLPDRGLDFGDGLFETLRLTNGIPQYLDLHLGRLSRGLDVLGFPSCMSQIERDLSGIVRELARSGAHDGALRLTVTRGAGPRGYAAPRHPSVRTVVAFTPVQDEGASNHPALRLGLANVRWPLQPALAGLKHLNRLEQVLAAAERESQGMDELLMLGPSGDVISVISGNFFAVIQGRIITPALDNCGIAGTRRQLVLERWAPACGLPSCERPVALDELAGADELFISNALTGLRPIASFDVHRWTEHPVVAALQAQCRGDLR